RISWRHCNRLASPCQVESEVPSFVCPADQGAFGRRRQALSRFRMTYLLQGNRSAPKMFCPHTEQTFQRSRRSVSEVSQRFQRKAAVASGGWSCVSPAESF